MAEERLEERRKESCAAERDTAHEPGRRPWSTAANEGSPGSPALECAPACQL